MLYSTVSFVLLQVRQVQSVTQVYQVYKVKLDSFSSVCSFDIFYKKMSLII